MLGGSGGEDPHQPFRDEGFFSMAMEKVEGRQKRNWDASDRFEAGESSKAARIESVTILDEKTKRMWRSEHLVDKGRTNALMPQSNETNQLTEATRRPTFAEIELELRSIYGPKENWNDAARNEDTDAEDEGTWD